MDIEEILHNAIKIEREGIRLYTKSAEKVADQNGKGILLFLAREEERHLAFFQEMLKEHGKEGEKVLKLLMVPRIFPEPHNHEEGMATGVDEEILGHAKDVEKRSIDFYSDAFRAVSDNDLRAGLEAIIREEKQHLEWVEYLIGTIGTHEYWGDLQDHFSLDG